MSVKVSNCPKDRFSVVSPRREVIAGESDALLGGLVLPVGVACQLTQTNQ